ncbi:hypothetical protein ACRTAK_002987 [Clostridium perfringens]
MDNIFYVNDNKICTKLKKVILRISNYGLIISTGNENIYFFIVKEKSFYSLGLVELFENRYKINIISTNFNVDDLSAGYKSNLTNAIIESIFLNLKEFDYEFISKQDIELMILLNIDEILNLKHTNLTFSYDFSKEIIKDILENDFNYVDIFKDTFKDTFI